MPGSAELKSKNRSCLKHTRQLLLSYAECYCGANANSRLSGCWLEHSGTAAKPSPRGEGGFQNAQIGHFGRRMRWSAKQNPSLVTAAMQPTPHQSGQLLLKEKPLCSVATAREMAICWVVSDPGRQPVMLGKGRWTDTVLPNPEAEPQWSCRCFLPVWQLL